MLYTLNLHSGPRKVIYSLASLSRVGFTKALGLGMFRSASSLSSRTQKWITHSRHYHGWSMCDNYLEAYEVSWIVGFKNQHCILLKWTTARRKEENEIME